MAPTHTPATRGAADHPVRDDDGGGGRPESAAETQAVRNLFDLRVIIGGLFTLYGIYLTIHGLLDSSQVVAKSAGVRINLWSGLGMLALAAGFLLWAKLRPLTLDRIVESQAGTMEADVESDRVNRERAQYTTAEHRAREQAGQGAGARRAP